MAARSLSLREKRLIQVAILLVIVVLLSLLLRGGGGAPPPGPPQLEVVPTPRPAPATVPAPAPVAAPVPAPVPAADLSQLRLHGVLASGAVISSGNGGQRLVPVGREVLPGLILIRIEQNHAILRAASGEVRLGFDGLAQAADVPGTVAAAPALEATGAPAQREGTRR